VLKNSRELFSTLLEWEVMNAPLIAILIAVPVIAAFAVFVLFPRLQRHEDEKTRR